MWPVIDAIPPGLPHENRGLVWADRPWDGYYRVTPLTWVIAQTTQFTAPGWRFAARANGSLPAGGSYETYLASGRSAWSMVAQTSVAGAAQPITVRVSGGLPARVVHVWSTSLRGAARSYTLSLTIRGSIISARINGVLVATVTNRMYRYGPAGLGSLGYYPVRYPGFTVRPQ